ncbi:hypothetical protein ACWEPC_53850, partial [Nonomuraea sp. NPDC004297]
PRQRYEPEPVGVIPPRPTANPAADHLVLVTEHQQLNILGQISADQHHQQAEQAPHQPIDKRQHHIAMIAATALITQRNPSSQHETAFSSGTRWDSSRRQGDHPDAATADLGTIDSCS